VAYQKGKSMKVEDHLPEEMEREGTLVIEIPYTAAIATLVN